MGKEAEYPVFDRNQAICGEDVGKYAVRTGNRSKDFLQIFPSPNSNIWKKNILYIVSYDV